MANTGIRQYFINSQNIHSYSGYAIVKTVQGIVNRKGPRLYLLGDSFAFSKTDLKWMEYYKEYKNYEFVELKSIKEVIAQFKDDFSGIITFDQKIRGRSK